jgi:hypothetical protein
VGESPRKGYRPEDFDAQIWTSYHKKTAYALEFEVQEFVKRWGINHVAFLTLTFAEHVLDKREAAKRFNSLLTNVLRKRYPQGVVMWERQKSGRWHVHCLVAVPWADIRTGFKWDAVDARDYQSASKALRREWAFWGRGEGTAKRYGFGRTEMRPIRSTGEAVAGYLAKYLSKHIEHRWAEDRKIRVMSYWGFSSKDPETGKTYRGAKRKASTVIAWTVSGREWRRAVAALAALLGVKSVEAITKILGPHWAYHLMKELEEYARHADTGISQDLGAGGVESGGNSKLGGAAPSRGAESHGALGGSSPAGNARVLNHRPGAVERPGGGATDASGSAPCIRAGSDPTPRRFVLVDFIRSVGATDLVKRSAAGQEALEARRRAAQAAHRPVRPKDYKATIPESEPTLGPLEDPAVVRRRARQVGPH